MFTGKTIINFFYLFKIILLLWCSQIAFSQTQISFRQLSVKEGLSQNSVVSVAQDSTGYLWMATQNGLNKYDGRSFKTYPFDFVDITRPTFSHLGKIYVDRKGSIFIIPLNKNLYKYNQVKDTFELIEGVSDASVLYQDENYNYWVGTYTNGLQTLDSTLSNSRQLIDSDQLATIYNIAKQNDETILISTDKQLIEIDINSFEHQSFIPQTFDGNKVEQNFSASLVGENSVQWIGTFGDGLYYRDSDNSTIINRFSDSEFNNPLPNNLNILDLHIDSNKRLWVATYGSGLYMIDFEEKAIQHFSAEKHNPRALHYNDILCIHQDYTGTLWFGTDGAGLSYYDEFLEKFNSFTNLQTPESISIDVVRAITVGNDQSVWLGTSGKGLTHYEPVINSWQTFTTFNSKLSSNRVMSLFLDEDELWIGTQGNGLVFYNEKDGFRQTENLEAKTIWTIFKDSQDRIWIGTQDQGLIQFNKSEGTVKQFTTSKTEISSNTIRVLTEDFEGNLWIGTDDKGLMRFNPEKEEFKNYRHHLEKNAISSNGIKSLYYDQNDILWIGTNGKGLNALDIKNEKFYHFTEEDGLANNVVYAILPDNKNNLWLSSNKGITRFSVDGTFKNPRIKNYNNYAGLATEFNTGAYFKNSNGELYFGGLEGFYWFNPNNIGENSIAPKTTITSLGVLNKTRQITQNLQLNHNENTVSFTFSSLQYALPEKNLYQYRLVNYDDDWVFSQNNNFVRYSRLSPGSYEFQVKSSNYDGIWNETPATFNFTIKAPWYFNSYSKILYILLFLLAGYLIYRYLKWRWQMKMNLQLQEKEAQRLKQLNDYKSKLYTDVAHEFRTPLTLISAPIDAKLTEGKLSDYDHANFSGIKRNTNRLTALVDQLLQLAKLEKGKQKLKLLKGNLGLFLNIIVEPFEYTAATKQIDFKVDLVKIKDVWYDEDVIEKIASNLLSNAIKYTPENGNILFKTTTQNSKFYLEMFNTVVNTETIEIEKLFDRFYQKDEYTEGVGVGLSLVNELVKLYNGNIEVEKKENTILFKVEIPLDKEAFAPDEIEIRKKEKLKINKELLESIDIEFASKKNLKDEKPILLVVEDNDEVRRFISRSLKHKYQIIEAANGQEGVEKALQHVPDIVLSDIRMPIKNGIELCNSLKTDERTSHIPIILLTADTGEENEMKGLESGADDFITKPFKLRILEKRLENLVSLRKALRNRYSQEYVLKPTDISLTSTDEIFLNKLQKIIDSEFPSPDFNAVAFSKKIGMSRMQLHRKLMAYTGLSTSAFIRSQRLKQAVEILKTSDATISEVAYSVGFNTPSYFIKCFKETYKKTPSEYLQTTDK